MDSGPQEKAVAEGIKQIVKVTSRRKPATHVRDRNHGRTLAPKINKESSQSPSETSDGADVLSTEEATLLMHFLDEVFPLQYPVYKPDTMMGGRGWLLYLLLRTKPLYHAVLALSSYHRLIIGSARLSARCRAFSAVRQEEQLQICLEEVQRTIREVDHWCILRFVDDIHGIAHSTDYILKLFAGEDCSWRIHLNAAIDMYQKEYRDGLPDFELSERSKAFLNGNVPLGHFDPEDDGPKIVKEVATLRFMEATVIWLDLIASITAGIAPRLLSYHTTVLQNQPQTDLENIFGCPSWIAIRIGQIAKLHNQLTQAKQQGTFFDSDILRSNIQHGLATARTSTTLSSLALIFTNMALVYLHLVVYGFQQLDQMNCFVAETTQVLHTQVSCNSIPVIVCPLFVIGCVVKPGEEQQSFKTALSSHPELGPLMRYRSRILPILEEVWIERENPTFTWNSVLEKTRELLLA
ncbi:transcription factor domain-containing protein [Aspergillus stella-maris]|uniref:transcription factor domain-containing protein n=1 Tax=Aspergillus stella-maris TaxID=1810926 RepID=UPI003CCDFB00